MIVLVLGIFLGSDVLTEISRALEQEYQEDASQDRRVDPFASAFDGEEVVDDPDGLLTSVIWVARVRPEACGYESMFVLWTKRLLCINSAILFSLEHVLLLVSNSLHHHKGDEGHSKEPVTHVEGVSVGCRL